MIKQIKIKKYINAILHAVFNSGRTDFRLQTKGYSTQTVRHASTVYCLSAQFRDRAIDC